jgi:hypothetical protein
VKRPRIRILLHWLLPIGEKLFGPVTPERWGIIHHYIRKSGHFVGCGTVSLGFF